MMFYNTAPSLRVCISFAVLINLLISPHSYITFIENCILKVPHHEEKAPILDSYPVMKYGL